MRPNNLIVLLVMTGVITAFPLIALGSFPVEYAIVGCIKQDKFYMNGATTPSLMGSPIKALDAKTIRVEGFLSPGDYFRAVALFVVDDRCREHLHQSYFLCDPCRTLADDDSPSRPVPRREKGIAVQIPPEVIKQFDNLPHLMRNNRPR